MAFQQKDPREIQKRIERQKAEAAKREATIKRHRELFAALTDFCRERQAFLISAPGSDLRIDALPGSTVAADLTARGFLLRSCGTNLRTVPDGFVETDCYL